MSPNKQQSTINDTEILDNRNKQQQESNSSKRKNGNAVTEKNGQPIANGNKDRVNSENGKFLPAPTSIMDFILGMLTQIARRYLFIDAAKKAMAYLVVVVILSLIAEVFPIPRDYYLVQKHNVLNRFGIKIGWFWTSLLLCPFMWLTSLLHHESLLKASFDQLRLLIATFAWYFWTNFFVKIEYQTGRCHGSVGSSRNDCYVDGGKWIPGFDISGHAFLLLYSILIITEEATSFRNWPIQPRVTAQHIPTRKDYNRFQQKTKFIQWNFVLLFALCLLWDFSLCVTALYYHNLIQKLIGASIAVFCWAVTYRLWYYVGFPFLPIRRHIKTF